jgi:hypothetical protein
VIDLSQLFCFFLGFLFQSIQLTFVTFGLGVAVVLAVCALKPPHGMLNEKFACACKRSLSPLGRCSTSTPSLGFHRRRRKRSSSDSRWRRTCYTPIDGACDVLRSRQFIVFFDCRVARQSYSLILADRAGKEIHVLMTESRVCTVLVLP